MSLIYLAPEDDRPGDKTMPQRRSLGGGKIYSRFRLIFPSGLAQPGVTFHYFAVYLWPLPL